MTFSYKNIFGLSDFIELKYSINNLDLLSLLDLFKIVKIIEKKIGRKKTLKNHPRVCDIDIIDFNGINLKTEFNPKINIEDYFIEDIIQRGIRDNFLDYKKPHKSYDLFELRKIWEKKR